MNGENKNKNENRTNKKIKKYNITNTIETVIKKMYYNIFNNTIQW